MPCESVVVEPDEERWAVSWGPILLGWLETNAWTAVSFSPCARSARLGRRFDPDLRLGAHPASAPILRLRRHSPCRRGARTRAPAAGMPLLGEVLGPGDAFGWPVTRLRLRTAAAGALVGSPDGC